MVSRPEAHEFAEHFAPYVGCVPDGDLLTQLRKQADDFAALLSGVSAETGDFRYAPGKWSLKEVVGHITDTERIMSYRTLRVARGDKTSLPGFDENLFMSNAGFDRFSLQDLLGEYKLVRETTLAMLARLTDEAWLRIGSVNGHDTTARALGFIIAGHDLHHQNIVKERYLGKSEN